MSEQFTFFWNGPFSQHHIGHSFVIDGVKYVTAEQYMMQQKALLFGDNKIANLIMATKNPREQKALGREVDGFDKNIWNEKARLIVKKGNIAKFSQDPYLLVDIEATKGTTLVEASPYDTVWGIGLSEWEEDAKDRTKWKGTNWLGEVLTEVRIELCGE